MKKVIFIFGILILGAAIFLFWYEPFEKPGARHSTPDPRIPTYEEVTYQNHQFHVVRVNLQKHNLKMYYQDDQGERYGSFEALEEDLNQHDQELVFAANGGIYAEDFSPLGLYIEDGEKISSLNTSTASTGNFFLQPNGVFEISPTSYTIYTTKEWSSLKNPTSSYAVQSGPMLLIDGGINNLFAASSSNREIRSGVGYINQHELVFVLSRRPISFYDFASFFRDGLGARRALYLDGVTSNFYVDGKTYGNIRTEYSTIIGVALPK